MLSLAAPGFQEGRGSSGWAETPARPTTTVSRVAASRVPSDRMNILRLKWHPQQTEWQLQHSFIRHAVGSQLGEGESRSARLIVRMLMPEDEIQNREDGIVSRWWPVLALLSCMSWNSYKETDQKQHEADHIEPENRGEEGTTTASTPGRMVRIPMDLDVLMRWAQSWSESIVMLCAAWTCFKKTPGRPDGCQALQIISRALRLPPVGDTELWGSAARRR